MKIFGKLFGLFFGATLIFIGLFSCLLVILTGFMIEQLPFGHDEAWTWYVGKVSVTSQARFGFGLLGYTGPEGTVDGLPVPYPVTSHFGYSSDYFGGRIYHTGVDMACPTGTPVTNMIAGKVSFAGYSNAGYGYLVVVENNGVQSFYGHLSRIDVQVGQVVDAGTVVGATGNTGWSTGPHLHWEVRVDGVPTDPLQGIPKDRGE